MCGSPQQPASVSEALVMLDRALDALTGADAGSLPVVVQAQVLRALGKAEAKQTAARGRLLAAFSAQEGYADDSVCQIHHLIPRSNGGPTALSNLITLCAFHHLIAIHGWGWTLRLHPDGTTTATSPDGRRVFHSHGPPTNGPPTKDPPSRVA